MAIGFGASKKDIDKNSRRLKRNERRANRIASRKNKNVIKQNFSDGLGILQIVMLIILIITIARILSGTLDGNYPFSQFFNELISFDGINIFEWINWKFDFNDNLNWLEELLNSLFGLQGFSATIAKPFKLILFSLVNAAIFIIHIVGVLFGF